MKITCSKSKLLEGVQIVSRAVPNKTTLDIMQYIMVEADDNFQEALAVMMMVYQLSEEEGIRRLMA